MTTDPSPAGTSRPAQRSRELADQLLPIDTGIEQVDVRTGVEESPYERFFTGGDTVMAKPRPLRVDTARIVLVGTGIWALALLVVVFVPTLHSGSRDWWPWTCVAGVALGLIGFSYVRRGRGNAEAA